MSSKLNDLARGEMPWSKESELSLTSAVLYSVGYCLIRALLKLTDSLEAVRSEFEKCGCTKTMCCSMWGSALSEFKDGSKMLTAKNAFEILEKWQQFVSRLPPASMISDVSALTSVVQRVLSYFENEVNEETEAYSELFASFCDQESLSSKYAVEVNWVTKLQEMANKILSMAEAVLGFSSCLQPFGGQSIEHSCFSFLSELSRCVCDNTTFQVDTNSAVKMMACLANAEWQEEDHSVAMNAMEHKLKESVASESNTIRRICNHVEKLQFRVDHLSISSVLRNNIRECIANGKAVLSLSETLQSTHDSFKDSGLFTSLINQTNDFWIYFSMVEAQCRVLTEGPNSSSISHLSTDVGKSRIAAMNVIPNTSNKLRKGPVEDQVSQLIAAATDPQRLSLMFEGWMPWI